MTYLEERVKIADFNRLWEEAITLPDGSYSRRQTDDEAEREFWKGFMGRKRSYQRDDTAETVMEAVRKLLADCRTASILEIGPGWGNYTMELAKLCDRMTCVDISPEVLSYIDQTAREQEIRHVTGVCSKWETFSSAERYDVVFGYNCFYRMRSLEECFRKMNETAEKICIAHGVYAAILYGDEEGTGVQADLWEKGHDLFYQCALRHGNRCRHDGHPSEEEVSIRRFRTDGVGRDQQGGCRRGLGEGSQRADQSDSAELFSIQ